MVAFLALALGCAAVAQAQMYHFEKVPVPANRSLHTLYAYYVYSMDEAPDRSQGRPFVKFSKLEAHTTSSSVSNADMKDYKSIQLSIMRYQDFWELINPQKFCSTAADVESGLSRGTDQLLVQRASDQSMADVNVYSHVVRFPSDGNERTPDVRKDVGRSGVYVLVFSNCGQFQDAVVSGTVIVKNPYGFLPGNEYHKMPFYGWLLIVYSVLAIGWMVLSLRWWKEIFSIQNCISAVILLGLLESFLWYVFFTDWNSSGVRGRFLFVMAILFTVVKSTFSYMLVLVASLGWGVTRPFLDTQVTTKIQLLSFLYIVLDFIREAVLSFQHSHSLSLSFVLLCLLPVALLNGAIFYWIFTALSSLMESLQERRQFEKLALFQRLWRILLGALIVATLTLLFQIITVSRSISSRWRYQWLLTDGVSHVIFLIVLVAMMYLWAPHKNAQRFAYSHQVDSHEKDAATAGAEHPDAGIWADEAGDDGEDDDSFWAATRGGKDSGITKSKVPAEVVGAREAGVE